MSLTGPSLIFTMAGTHGDLVGSRQCEPAKPKRNSGEAGRKRSAGKVQSHQFTRALAMRKVFLLAAALTVTGFMANARDAFACELNPEASQPAFAIRLSVNPAQNPFVPVDCTAAYFDPGTYSGSDGLFDWLIALVHAESQHKPEPGIGFPPSPMDAYAQYR